MKVAGLIVCAALLLGMVLASSCTKEETMGIPVIHLTVQPDSGNTVNRFKFDLSRSESRSGRGVKLFARWDWEGDGIWDTPFTRLLVYEHRYYAPGTWYPRVELMNLDGGIDSLSVTIPVSRGASPPRVSLKIRPPGGHIFEDYLLDATGTVDDEDSLYTLKFMWDYNGDGVWDTPFIDSASLRRRYPDPGHYLPTVMVRDPSGLANKLSVSLLVTQNDPLIRADFTWKPDSVVSETDILFDASNSFDPSYPDKPLKYRWDWDNNGQYDTGWTNNPEITTQFVGLGNFSVRLQVMSSRFLFKDTVKTLRVWYRNKPPRAHFSVSTIAGNTQTVFRFDSWSCRDPEVGPSRLLVRWDFNGDGTWDTQPSYDKVIDHTFRNPGTYPVTLEACDEYGNCSTYTMSIYVDSGTYQTGLYEDKRGVKWEYYGTVRIGDQWWFARNVCVQDTNRYYQHFYDTNWWNSFDYGNLYNWLTYQRTCPEGWRVPTRSDWDQLFSNYPSETLFDKLLPGGGSGFNLILSGMGERKGPQMVYSGLNRYGHYWSSTNPSDPAAISTWIVSFDLGKREIIAGWWTRDWVVYAVRCVRE